MPPVKGEAKPAAPKDEAITAKAMQALERNDSKSAEALFDQLDKELLAQDEKMRADDDNDGFDDDAKLVSNLPE